MVSASNSLIDSPDEQITLMENGIPPIGEELQNQIVSLSSVCAGRTIPSLAFRILPETLEAIFILGACDYYESKGGIFTPSVPTWVNFSYVCRHWRNVALNCPILWTYHFNTSGRWTKELLLRSKHAPLKISICPSFQPLGEVVLNEVLKHSERIQELRLDMSILLPAKLSLSTPLLKNLEIRLKLFDPNESIEIPDRDDLRLHTLTLADCSLPWYSLNLSELKTLSLYHVCPYSQPGVGEFLSVLSSMQHLTVLDLEHSLPSARDFLSKGGLHVSSKINLPRLTLLALAEPLSTIVAFLSCVNIPPTTQLNLFLRMESGTSIGDYAPISSFLAKQFSTVDPLSGLAFRSLFLDFGLTLSLTFSLDCEPLSGDEDVSCNIPLKIFLDGEDDWELTKSDAACIMRDICCSLPLANIQRLHVLCPEVTPNIWDDILGCMHGLRYMKLSHGHMPGLSLLSRTAHKPEEGPAGQPISDQDLTPGHTVVPALEELELHTITFASDYMSSNKWMSKESLLDALSTRAGLRDRLIMTCCRE